MANAFPSKVIGYVRVSTGEQALGPEVQAGPALLAWCEAHGCKLIEVFSDQGIGDAALVEQRVQKLGASIRAVDGSGNTDTPGRQC